MSIALPCLRANEAVVPSRCRTTTLTISSQRQKYGQCPPQPPPEPLHANGIPTQKIPCEFQLEIPELGYLDNNPSQPLRAGAKIALPLWLGEMLVLAGSNNSSSLDEDARGWISFNLPAALGPDVVAALKADPRAVPLRDRSAHFYALAARMLELSEEKELAAVLRKTYVMRAGEVGLHARKVGGGGKNTAGHSGRHGKEEEKGSNLGVGGVGEDFLRGLDEWERKLFRQAHDGTRAGKEYLDDVMKQ